MNQHLPLRGPPKFTQNGISGLKICHLATLLLTPPPMYIWKERQSQMLTSDATEKYKGLTISFQSGILYLATLHFVFGNLVYCILQLGILYLATRHFVFGNLAFCIWQLGILYLAAWHFLTVHV
jgi:hypothetical protein